MLYSAPELMLGNPAKDGYDGAAVDIWSSAICLYNMLFGIMPFLVRQQGGLVALPAKTSVLAYPSQLQLACALQPACWHLWPPREPVAADGLLGSDQMLLSAAGP